MKKKSTLGSSIRRRIIKSAVITTQLTFRPHKEPPIVEAAAQLNERQGVAKTYQWLVIAVGLLVFLGVAPRLPFERIDLQFLLIAVMTVMVSSRVAVKIPRFNTSVTISDTFIFLAILMYGGEAAILF